MDARYVIKIGGSLVDSAGEIASTIRSAGKPALIVPGGGPFVDFVRKYQVSDEESHWMAVAGMEQYGWFLSAYGLPVTKRLEKPCSPVIFLPYCTLQEEDPLPHTWDITSDTIAAWVAFRLGLDLVLLKSVQGITSRGVLVSRVTSPIECEEVDPCFIPFVIKHGVRTWIINGSNQDRLLSLLNGEQVEGTMIGTIF